MRRIACLPLCLCLSPAIAGDWSGQAALGFLATDGNTHSKSLNAKVDAVWAQSPWKDIASLAAINTSGDTTAERYTASDKLDYDFTPRDYLFGEVEFEKDLVGAVRQRTAETVGYGRHVLTGPSHLLDLEIGGGARQAEDNVTREKHNELIGRMSGKYTWKISDTTAFVETAKSEVGADNTFTESVAELRMPVAGDLSAVLSYTLRNNSSVPPGVHHTDTATAAALSYSFGGPQ